MLSNLVAVASIGACVNKLPLASSGLVFEQRAPSETPLTFGVFQSFLGRLKNSTVFFKERNIDEIS